MSTKLEDLIKTGSEFMRDVTTLRHQLHTNPELGFDCDWTQKTLIDRLTQIGLSGFRTMGKTGFIVDIKGGGPEAAVARNIALRSDMDGLPLQEQNKELPYKSRVDGRMHACGHDGHMASLFGAATILHNKRDLIPKNCSVRILYQPAEEGPGGAPVMIEEGCLEGVDEIYGYHNWPSYKNQALFVKSGPLMAHVAEFDITIRGKGGHASQPHIFKDPIVAAANVIIGLHTIVSRGIHSSSNAVVSVASIHGGTTAHNVIPDDVVLLGTVRDIDLDTYDTIARRIKEIAESVSRAYECTADVNIRSSYPVLVNTEKETNYVKEIGKQVFGEDKISEENLPMMGAEDFAYFVEKIPGCFYFIGSGTDEQHYPCHSSHFNFNDEILPKSIEMYIKLVEHRLQCKLFN